MGFVLVFGPLTEARIVGGLTRPPRSLRLLRTSCGIVMLTAPFASPRGSISRQTSPPSPSPPYSPSPPRNPFLVAVRLLQVGVARWILSPLSPSLSRVGVWSRLRFNHPQCSHPIHSPLGHAFIELRVKLSHIGDHGVAKLKYRPLIYHTWSPSFHIISKRLRKSNE